MVKEGLKMMENNMIDKGELTLKEGVSVMKEGDMLKNVGVMMIKEGQMMMHREDIGIIK